MPGFVGADVEQLDAYAVQLDRRANAYREVASSSTLALMVATWTGADIDRVRSEWTRQSRPAILRIAQELTALAVDVRRQASDQRATSSAGSGRLSSGSHSEHRVPRIDPPIDGPGNIRDLVGGTKGFTGSEWFSVTEVVGPDGETRLIVTLPGTHGKLEEPWGWGQVGGWGENPNIWLERNSEIRDKLAFELEQVLAAYPDAEVMLVGHSQGGMLAQSIADDPSFEINEVVTIGSPVMYADHGYGGANITRLEHRSDWVVNLTDAAAVVRNELAGHGVVAGLVQRVRGLDEPARGSELTVRGGSFFEGAPLLDTNVNPGNAHDVDVGDYDWLADRFDGAADAGSVAARERMQGFLGGTVVGKGFVR